MFPVASINITFYLHQTRVLFLYTIFSWTPCIYVKLFFYIVYLGTGHVSRTTYTLSKKTQQHCYRCLMSRQQAVPWLCNVRTIFSFFRSEKKTTEPEVERPLPTYPIIHDLGECSTSVKSLYCASVISSSLHFQYDF